MHYGFKARAESAPHSLVALVYSVRTRPSLGHDKACGTKDLLPQPSQSVGRFKGTIPYQRRRLSWNSSNDNSVLLRLWGIAVSHAPFSVSCQRRFNPTPSDRSFCLVNAQSPKNPAAFSHHRLLYIRNLYALCS